MSNESKISTIIADVDGEFQIVMQKTRIFCVLTFNLPKKNHGLVLMPAIDANVDIII